ncbi:MAG TPA: PLP-dependent aminotransferase family protein, partial [Vicinamibacterales bacterium]|nr:PLP-dependent aminotransferase family protein [Vicinamibacterales bacterium]
ESRSGSGTWVSARSRAVIAARHAAHATSVAASPLFGLLVGHDEAGDVIDVALGTPLPLEGLPPDLFVLPPEEHTALLRDRLYHPLGWPALRRAIAAEHSRRGLDTTPDQVLVTNGAQQAIALSAALCVQRGDTILVEDPAYFGVLDVGRTIGARIVGVPVGADGVSPSAIRDRIAATGARLIYLTPTFQNPTGAVMPAPVRREIGRIAAATGVAVIDDCTMADLAIDPPGGSTPAPIAAHAPDAPILTIGSLSKLVWPGLRVGWIRASEPMIQRLVRIKTAMDLSCPLLTQAIATRVVGAIGEARRLRQIELRPRRDLLRALLREHLPAWRFRVPNGGLFLWTELPQTDAREFAQVAFRHGVVTLAGSHMSTAGEHSSFLRVPFFAEPDTLRTAVDRLAAAWREHRSAPRERRQAVAIV